jgi:hypothetical protein
MNASLVRDVAFRQHEGLCVIRIMHFVSDQLYAWTVEWPGGRQTAPAHSPRFHPSIEGVKALADAWVHEECGHDCGVGCSQCWSAPSRFDR